MKRDSHFRNFLLFLWQVRGELLLGVTRIHASLHCFRLLVVTLLVAPNFCKNYTVTSPLSTKFCVKRNAM